MQQHRDTHDIPLYINEHDLDQVYNDPHYTLTRDDTNLYITIGFPLPMLDTHITLYRIEAFRLPIHDQLKHTSRVANVPSYLAWSERSEWSLEMS